MGSRVLYWWECERCGGTDSGDDVSYQPKDWVTIQLSNPPKSSELTVTSTLCGACADLLDRWLNYKTAMPKPGPKTPSTAELAAIVKEAEEMGRTPQGLLRERLGVSESTVHRYLKRVRMAAKSGAGTAQ